MGKNHVYWNQHDAVAVMISLEKKLLDEIEDKLLDDIEREIDEAGMDIPKGRRRDPYWLARNAGIRGNPVGRKLLALIASYTKVSRTGTEE